MRLTKKAKQYGFAVAEAYFKDRKGHGGGQVGKVVLTKSELAAFVAMGYDRLGEKNVLDR